MTEKPDIYVQCAWLYYEFNMTQAEIASQMGVSRSTVSRALRVAENRGIVRHVVTAPLPAMAELEIEIIQHTGLDACRVIPRAESLDVLARGAALFLDSQLSGDETVAMGWGRTIRLVASHLPSRRLPNLKLVDAIGHATVGGAVDALGTTREAGAAYRTDDVKHLIAPGVFDPTAGDHTSRQSSANVAEVLETAAEADLVVISVGTIGDTPLIMRMTELFSRAEVDDLIQRGAVADVLGCFIDTDGNEVPHEFGVLGIGINALRANDGVMVVAGGKAKIPGVIGAIRGGIANTLVCDETIARAILGQDKMVS